ncbi:MAG: hypothetical protein K2Q10_09910, partial [Rhodospirillales bacterium]|nr:hypothetical protein [Rhodospirillales bacterium]
MSVINRFEVANYLNLDQTADWRPDYRHVVFNLRGQSTAINLGNGGGKSTLTRGILVLLGRDREFQSMTRDKMAPENTGVYSHLRIELLFRDEPREADLFARAGGNLPGEPWVFGVYGYSGKGQQLHFYRYQGRLEDCPVAGTSGRKVVLIDNEAFRHTLRQVRGVLVNPDSPEWLREVGRHFDPGSVRQMIEYQKRGAGDGTASFFKVTRLPGERYDEAFFYNVLAPEVLVGVMGAEAERDEHRFEDTVLISARTISDAMYAADRKRREVETLERACQEVEKVKGRVEDFAAARRRYEAECSGLAAEAAFLEHIVLTQPLPGIPAAPLPEAPQTAWTAARLVLADGQWLLPDWAIGDITGEEPSRLNERARRKQMGSVAIRPGHVIEVPQAGDTAPERRHSGAPANAGYGREAATRLIAEASHIAEGWERDAAQRAVNGAFTWIDKAETNMRRKKAHALSAEIADLKTRIQDLAHAEHDAEQIQRGLALRRQSVHAARHAQERMSASGLFSAEELTAPAATGAKVKHERQAAAAARAAHEREAARLARPFAAWQDFTAEHGSGADPSALAARLEAARTEAEARADQAREHREELLEQLAAAEREASEIERRLTAATAAAEELEALLPGVQSFAARFPDRIPTGLEEAGDRALKEARQRRHDLDRRLHGLKNGIARLEALQPGLEVFRALFDAESPRGLESACLAARDEARQRLTRLDAEQAGLSRHIQALAAFRAAHGEAADAQAIAAARRQRWEDLAGERRR